MATADAQTSGSGVAARDGGIGRATSRAVLVALALAGLGGRGAEPALRVVVTTSMIEAAVAAVSGGPQAGVEIVRLLPPGSCPGHFDLSGRDLTRLTGAQCVFRHDYQTALDGKLATRLGDNVPTVALDTPGSLLIPRHFLALAEQVQARLAAALPAASADLTTHLEQLRRELQAREDETRQTAAPWRDCPVIASAQQREFCAWLGLKVVGELPRAEDLSPRDLAALQRSAARAVVGNLQSDGLAASVLAKRLHVPLAVLSNFPGAQGYGEGYLELFRRNLEELGRACRIASPN